MAATRWPGALLLVVPLLTTVSARESTVHWTLDDEVESQSCIYSLSGDPTEWVPRLNLDSEYEVPIDPFCTDSAYIRIGPLAGNPSNPDALVTSDRYDNSLMFFEVMADGDVETFFGGSLNVTGIAVDYQSQNAYYTDPEVGIMIVQVGVSRPYFDVILKDLDDPRHITVDPDKGYIFWAEATAIRRASLTGSSARNILTGVSRDTLFALDRDSRQIIVLDQEEGTLRSMSYDGRNVKTLVTDVYNSTASVFSGLAADQGYIFGAVADKAELIIWDENTGKKMAELSMPVDQAKQLSITVNNVEPLAPTSPCAKNNGGCSQMCIHKPSNSRVCRCNMGYVLQSDGKTCKPGYLKDNFVLVTDIEVDGIYQIDINTGRVHGIPVQQTVNQRIHAAVYDPVDELVIWADTGNGTLRSREMKHGGREYLIFTFDNESVIEDLAFDSEQRAVYYTDSGLSQIGRISLDKAQEVILQLDPDEQPFQIELNPDDGYMYWTNVGSPATIERANMTDGSDRLALVKTEIQFPSGLALNISESKLYWIDFDQQRFEEIYLNGTNREMIEADPDIYTLALDDNYLYATRQHEVRRYTGSNHTQSTLGPKFFSVLNGISLYASGMPSDTSAASHIVGGVMILCISYLLEKFI